jgi:FAD/FMN-containing dehydrogenase
MIMDWPVDIDASAHVRWLKDYWATVEPHTRGAYANDVTELSQQAVHSNYSANFDRLLALKNRYDPTNLFRLNANIAPTV